jgi:hypothetical protein
MPSKALQHFKHLVDSGVGVTDATVMKLIPFDPLPTGYRVSFIRQFHPNADTHVWGSIRTQFRRAYAVIRSSMARTYTPTSARLSA